MQKKIKAIPQEELIDLQDFCKAMRFARRRRHMTQKDLSAATGITQGDISKLERGNSNPSLKTLQRIADGLKLQLKVELRKKHKSSREPE